MRLPQRLSTTLVLLTIALILTMPTAFAADEPQATVVVSALNVRQGPGTSYAIATVVHAGDSLPITGRNAATTWYRISLPDGHTGWVSASLVQVTGDPSGVPEIVTAAATTSGTRSSQGSVIVFQTCSDGPIYAVDPDGSNLRYLTTGIDPALSPDGQWVAFTRWDGVQNGVTGSLWVINVDGTGERQVMSGASQPKSPTWSADGQQVVIGMQHGGTLDDTYRCMIDGVPVVVPNPIQGARCMPQRADPHWSLRLVNMADGTYQDLPHDAHSFAPTWDPANSWHVVFRGDRGLMSLDLNEGTTWLVKESGAQRGPVFSPDGTKIATTFKQNDHWEVHVMNADGTGEVRLTETPMKVLIDQILQGELSRSWNNAAPAWSPDGSQLAFITDRNGAYELWVMNADGTNQHPLLSTADLNGLAIHYDGVDERVISWR